MRVKIDMSLRNRIAFYFMAVTALSTAILFLLIYNIVLTTVYTHLDADLEAEYSEVSSSVVYAHDELIFANNLEWTEQEHGQVEVNPTFIQVVDPEGNNLKKTANLWGSSLIFHPHVIKKEFYNTTVAGSTVRQIQAPLRPDNHAIRAYLIVAIPLEESAMVLSNLKYVLFISFPIVLLLLFAVSRMIAGKIISPVNMVIATADRITRENMNERIPAPPHHDELYKLSETINNLLDRLQDAVLREQQFTADASHELRSPISVIKGTLEVLIRKEREPEQYREKIKYVISEVNRMASLVEQLLSLARYESGGIQPMMGPVDLRQLIEEAMPRFEEAIADKNLTVTRSFQDSVMVNADVSMSEIILENLISNAVKYSVTGSTISMQAVRTGNGVEFSIANAGHTIPPEQIESVFDRFYRVDQSRAASIEGNGLGLAIVKRLADLQGLLLFAESTPENGTRFCIRFAGIDF